MAIQDVDEFVLCCVRMAQGRNRARCELGEIDAEVGQAKQVAQWMLFAALHLGCERLWIVGRLGALGGVGPLKRGVRRHGALAIRSSVEESRTCHVVTQVA